MRKYENVYNKNIECLYEELISSPNGLNNENIIRNRKEYGENVLKEKKRKNKAQVFLEQYKNLLVILLIIAAIISIFTGGIENTCVILFVITLNAVIGTIQYNKAEKSLDSLRKLSKGYQRVIRDGIEIKIPENEVVVGDILLFNSGDIVTADCRIVRSNSLEVDESSLTGESIAVLKDDEVIEGECLLAEQKNIVFKGSKIVNGKALGICYAVGMNTEIGKIAALMDETDNEKTPLEISIDNFSKHLALIIVIICGIVFVVGIYNHIKIMDSLMFAIALAVAAIPEALFTILTIVLAIGTEKMAKEKAIVKDIRVVETLGCVNVIATDKTGTLTENKMKVTNVLYDGLELSKINDDSSLYLYCLALCNDSCILDLDGLNIKTDTSILAHLLENKINVLYLRDRFKRISEIPFNSKRKYMASVNIINGKKLLFCKGASEVLINKCCKYSLNNIERNMNESIKNEILNKVKELGQSGLRVLTLCYKDVSLNYNINDDSIDGLTYLGLIALSDPPKQGVKEAIEECIDLKIKPVMITGDHVDTATAIGKMVGINGNAMNGKIEGDISGVNVFARVTPSQKINIVSNLQKDDNIVAFVGDGVNDAPAIKKADVGISMGISGTDVSKEAASIILMDDNYQTIVRSIKRGRGIFDNIQNVILYLISGNIAGLLMVLFTSIFDLPMPFAPVHLLFINLVNDSLPAIAIGIDDNFGEDNNKPRPAKLKILNKNSVIKILTQGILLFLGTALAFIFGLQENIYVARTMAFSTLAMSRLFHCFNCRGNYSILNSRTFNKLIYISLFVGLILVGGLLFIPFLSNIFLVSKLNEYQIVAIIFLSIAPTVIMQIGLIIKELFKKLKNNQLK